MSIVLKSGSLKLLEPSGPLQACNGTALPLIYNKTVNIRINVTLRQAGVKIIAVKKQEVLCIQIVCL